MLSIREKKYTVYFSKTVRVHTLFNKNIVHEKVKLDILFYSVRIKNGLKIERHRLSLNHSQTMNLSIPKPKYNIPYSSEKLPRGLLKSKINHVIFTPLKRPAPPLIDFARNMHCMEQAHSLSSVLLVFVSSICAIQLSLNLLSCRKKPSVNLDGFIM